MRSLLRFAGQLLRPTRRAHAVPMGRLAIASLFVFVALFVVFTLSSMGVQLPFVDHPYVVRAWFADAAGLDPANGPQVSVAGVPEGQVTGVSYQGGRALVTMSLDSAARGRVFRDASVQVRPFNAANFLQVDIEPGHPAAGALPAGTAIDVARTQIPVATDQVMGVLDADTRAYLQILTEQLATGLHERGDELTRALARLAPLSDDARQIGATLAARHRLLSDLVGETRRIFGVLGRRHAELAATIGAATRLLAVTSARTRELETATRRLPQVLSDAGATGTAVSAVAPELETALRRVQPAAGAFAGTLRDARGAVPSLNALLAAAASLTRGTEAPSRELRSLSAHLQTGVEEAIAGYRDLIVLIHAVIAHETPIARFVEAISGLFSTQDAYGVLGRVKLLGIQPPTAEDLGLPASAAHRGPGGYSRLDTMLAQALGALCRRRTEPLACVTALITPGLPGSLVTRGARVGRR